MPIPPILVAKQQGASPGLYFAGWLFENGQKATWLVWSKGLGRDAAVDLAMETVNKTAPRDVYFWDAPLPGVMTTEQELDIRWDKHARIHTGAPE